MKQPLFSIVIPSLDRGDMLDRCLASICSQNVNDVEIIVVDGGSTDTTPQVLKRYASRVHAIVEQGIGVSDARNAGVRRASGRFIVFVDSDDLLLESALGLYASLIDQQQCPPLILAAYREFTDEGQLAGAVPRIDIPKVQRFATYLDAAAHGHLSGTHRLIIDRAVYIDGGGLDASLRVCEDQDFGLRINQVGPCVVVLHPATVGYRRHHANISASAESFGFGAQWLIRNERRGVYPGGSPNRRVRRAVITRTARSASLECIKHGRYHDAMAIYRDTLPWHLAEARFKYLLGFPVKALATAIVAGRSQQVSPR